MRRPCPSSRAEGTLLVNGNRVKRLIDAAQNYPAWLQAIASARDHVHFERYIHGEAPVKILGRYIDVSRLDLRFACEPWNQTYAAFFCEPGFTLRATRTSVGRNSRSLSV
jgi:hypothetical protein